MAGSMQRERLLLACSDFFPLQDGLCCEYGTAGFRGDGMTLSPAVFAAGVVAALRSLKCGGAVIGMMITASHNPVGDNGVKIADPDGGMLDQSWEPFANSLANSPHPASFIELVLEFAKTEDIPLGEGRSAEVFLGRDTRPTGLTLIEAAIRGINAIIGVSHTDMGILTTPQLHWMVRNRNRSFPASESDYYTQLSKSFQCLMELIPKEHVKDVDNKLIVDGANGIGGVKLDVLKEKLVSIHINVRNAGKQGKGVLNEKCGADYVQKEKVVPCGFSSEDLGVRCASLDGDADRLVYFCIVAMNGNWIDLADGDKILSLFALFIKEQLGILNAVDDEFKLSASIGVVQTAYANGASTDFLNQLGLDVMLAPTGVKYLHKKALEYDVGIYFEANGHGTVLFSEHFTTQLELISNGLASKSAGSKRHNASIRLLAITQLMNQAVGDALSGLLLVEAILQHKGWSFQNWCQLYRDLPSRQLKVKVIDRSAIITSHSQTKVAEPAGLQELIDVETSHYSSGRCFVRPSGTEDVVRIYAEASTQEAADILAKSVALILENFPGLGVGQ